MVQGVGLYYVLLGWSLVTLVLAITLGGPVTHHVPLARVDHKSGKQTPFYGRSKYSSADMIEFSWL